MDLMELLYSALTPQTAEAKWLPMDKGASDLLAAGLRSYAPIGSPNPGAAIRAVEKLPEKVNLFTTPGNYLYDIEGLYGETRYPDRVPKSVGGLVAALKNAGLSPKLEERNTTVGVSLGNERYEPLFKLGHEASHVLDHTSQAKSKRLYHALHRIYGTIGSQYPMGGDLEATMNLMATDPPAYGKFSNPDKPSGDRGIRYMLHELLGRESRNFTKPPPFVRTPAPKNQKTFLLE